LQRAFFEARIKEKAGSDLAIRARRTRQTLRKLLVIDDDLKLLASYRDLLLPYGFEVLTAPDGEQAITLVEQNPDIMLVILDVVMPTMDGKEWLRWFRQRAKESPVIVISAYTFSEEDADLQPTAILQKPFHVAELLDLVGLFCGLSTPRASVTTV
jgi:DNA-binding response OmpR family regulator